MRWFIPDSISDERDTEVLALLDTFRNLRDIWGDFTPPGPIRRGDFMLLGTVANAGGHPVTVSWLAHAMRQSRPGISQRVSDLEEKGYLARAANSRDRRSATIHLTPEGRSMIEQGSEKFIRRMRRVMDLYGEENTANLLAQLNGLQTAIEIATQEEM